MVSLAHQYAVELKLLKLKQIFLSVAYLLLATFMALLSFNSFMNLNKQFGQTDFLTNSTNIVFMVFLLGTSLAGLIYLYLAFWRNQLQAPVLKWLHILAFVGLLPALLWFLWMFLFHLGL